MLAIWQVAVEETRELLEGPWAVSATVLVWGAGAIGGTIGAALARAGHDVLLVDRAADHVAAINRSGLEITGPIATYTVRARGVHARAGRGHVRDRAAVRQGAGHRGGDAQRSRLIWRRTASWSRPRTG